MRWPGEVAELVRLLDAVGRHCTCHASRECAAHQLLDAQHSLNHLVYARGARQHFIDAEWHVDGLLANTPTAHRPARPTLATKLAAAFASFRLALSTS